MTNMERKGKKLMHKKGVRLFAAAAMAVALIGVQSQGAFAQEETAIEEEAAILPENITIEEPMALSEISLPESEYGTLSWSDSSCVPSERVQDYEVVLEPFSSVDLSQYDGWDEENGVLVGYVTVVVSSITEPEYTEDPEISEVPEISQGPEVSVSPSGTVTPGTSPSPEEEGQGEDETLQGDSTEEEGALQEDVLEEGAIEAGQAEIGADSDVTPTVTEAPAENIFDQPDEVLEEDNRPVEAEENLSSEEKLARAAENHSCSGISVTGISLPWYVQFRVSSGEGYEFTNESDASIFKSYEFNLWDLRTDTEYQIPDGEYISVIVPVKEGYDYTIEHLLDNGAIETIIPSVEGDTMTFSTHSFSPFGIAGSKPLVGEDIAQEGYSDEDENTTEVTLSPAASANTVTTTGTSQVTAEEEESTSDNSVNMSSSDSSDTNTAQPTSTDGVVETGDSTVILPFVVLAVVAVALIAGVAVFMKKRK